MTERTKAERLLHPQCPEDYAVTLTADEAREVPELRPWVEAIEAAHAADHDRDAAHRGRAGLDRVAFRDVFVDRLADVAPGASLTHNATLYAGPQEENKLAALAPGLELVKDYGMLTLLANLNAISRFERGVTEPKRALTTVAALFGQTWSRSSAPQWGQRSRSGTAPASRSG